MFSLLIDYWRHAALEQIGNKFGTFIKASEATLQKRYTSCAIICVEMDVIGALHEELWLEYRDEVYFQAIDYEQISFRCRKCHEHGHMFREFPMNKTMEKPKDNTGKNKEAFTRPTSRQRANRKQQHNASTSIKSTGNTFKVLESETEAEEATKGKIH